MSGSTDENLLAGFDDDVFGATSSFRAVLRAMSRPAEVQNLPVTPPAPEGLNTGAVSVLMTLCDMDSPVWLAPECDTPQARAHLRFHAGCPIVENPAQAAFAVIAAGGDPDATATMPIGTPEYPDRSATVIVQADSLVADRGPSFSGPGIASRRRFDLIPAAEKLWRRVAVNHALFPRGLDWIFTSDSQLAALPRTTEVEF